MKKFLITLCFCMFLAPVVLVSQDVPADRDPTRTEVIQEKDKLVTMTIEYIPITDEARFVYSCPSGLFDQGAAMTAIKKRAMAFTKERGYYFYTYIRKDDTKYDNASKTAIYTSYIQFLH